MPLAAPLSRCMELDSAGRASAFPRKQERRGASRCAGGRPQVVRRRRLVGVDPDACLPNGAQAPVTSGNCPSRTHPRGIVYWDTIYIQLGLDALPGRPADDGLAGLMPTIFEYVDALGIYTFDADRRAGQLRPRRAA